MTFWQRLLNEPTLIAGAVRAVILCAVAFGLDWSVDQVAALMLAVETVLTLVTRAVVTPNQLAEYRVSQGYSPTQKITG